MCLELPDVITIQAFGQQWREDVTGSLSSFAGIGGGVDFVSGFVG